MGSSIIGQCSGLICHRLRVRIPPARPAIEPRRLRRLQTCGRGFDPFQSRQLGVAQLGSAPDLGSGGRQFNSDHPDQSGALTVDNSPLKAEAQVRILPPDPIQRRLMVGQRSLKPRVKVRSLPLEPRQRRLLKGLLVFTQDNVGLSPIAVTKIE